MSQSDNPIRLDQAALVAELERAGAAVKGKTVKCPWHGDTHASGSVYQDPAGVWRFHCHVCEAGGDVFDLRALNDGKPLADTLREANTQPPRIPPPAPKPERVWTLEEYQGTVGAVLEATYRYTNPATKAVELYIFRLREPDGGKTFRQAKGVPGGIVLKAPPKPWPIYNRTRLLGAEAVVVVEGEKCVHALAEIGIVATTSPCGAGKAAHADWSPLAGKTVVLWPDNDETGIKHMAEVREQLDLLTPAPHVAVIDPATLGLAPKGDVVDWLACLGAQTREEKRLSVSALLADYQPVTAGLELYVYLEAAIEGKRSCPRWNGWPILSASTQALLPGTITLLCGGEGSTKSMMLLWAFWGWHSKGIPVALYELEEDRQHHTNRLLAMLAGNPNLTSVEWVQAHAEEVREIEAQRREAIDSFGSRITCAPSKMRTLRELAEWAEIQAKAGARVIGLDPITSAQQGAKPWIDDLEFVTEIKRIMRQYQSSAILVTHPRAQGNKGRGLDDMAGGRAYPRFAQTVLWLISQQPEDVQVTNHGLTELRPVNRILRVNKSRNSWGTGLEIGYLFSPADWRISEQGVIAK